MAHVYSLKPDTVFFDADKVLLALCYWKQATTPYLSLSLIRGRKVFDRDVESHELHFTPSTR